jgi:hypothetical protein
METFAKLFGSLVVFVYHCFDRMVILGHLPLLTRPEHIVHFFRDVHGTYPITKEALRQRTDEYHRWVDAFAGPLVEIEAIRNAWADREIGLQATAGSDGGGDTRRVHTK